MGRRSSEIVDREEPVTRIEGELEIRESTKIFRWAWLIADQPPCASGGCEQSRKGV